jgi:hypothetical protein
MSFFHKGILTLWFSGERARKREPLVQGRAREYPTVEPAGCPRRFAVLQLARLEVRGPGKGILRSCEAWCCGVCVLAAEIPGCIYYPVRGLVCMRRGARFHGDCTLGVSLRGFVRDKRFGERLQEGEGGRHSQHTLGFECALWWSGRRRLWWRDWLTIWWM